MDNYHMSMVLLVMVSVAVIAVVTNASSALADTQTLAGDVNGDCKVDILDLAAVGLAFGSTPANSSGNWNPAADIKADGIIDIFDLAAVGLAYGDNCTASTIIDINWRLNSNYSNVFYLADKDSLDPNVTNVGIWEAPYGTVRFESSGEDVPAGWKLFFYDTDGQPAGVYSIVSEGAFGTSVFGDNPDTDLDEGVPMFTTIKVLAQNPQNRFFDAYFLQNDKKVDLPMWDRESTTPEYTIMVTNTEIP